MPKKKSGGRNSHKPANQRYSSENRATKNKELAQKRHDAHLADAAAHKEKMLPILLERARALGWDAVKKRKNFKGEDVMERPSITKLRAFIKRMEDAKL